MTEKLDNYIFVRLTTDLKNKFLEYCEKSGNISYSAFIRFLISRELRKNKKEATQ